MSPAILPPRSIPSPRVVLISAAVLGLAALWLLRKLAGKPRSVRGDVKPRPVIVWKPNKEDQGVGGGNIDIDDKVKTGPG